MASQTVLTTAVVLDGENDVSVSELADASHATLLINLLRKSMLA